MKKFIFIGAVIIGVIGTGFYAQQQANEKARKQVRQLKFEHDLDMLSYSDVGYDLWSQTLVIDGVSLNIDMIQDGLVLSIDQLRLSNISFDDGILYRAKVEVHGLEDPRHFFMDPRYDFINSRKADFSGSDSIPASETRNNVLNDRAVDLVFGSIAVGVVGTLPNYKSLLDLSLAYTYDLDSTEVSFVSTTTARGLYSSSIEMTIEGLEERSVLWIKEKLNGVLKKQRSLMDEGHIDDPVQAYGYALDNIFNHNERKKIENSFSSLKFVSSYVELKDIGLIDKLNAYHSQRAYVLPSESVDSYFQYEFAQDLIKENGNSTDVEREIMDYFTGFLGGNKTLRIETELEDPVSFTNLERKLKRVDSFDEIQLVIPLEITVN